MEKNPIVIVYLLSADFVFSLEKKSAMQHTA